MNVNKTGYFKIWGTPLVYLMVCLYKKYRPEQITVNELKADIRRWGGKKLPKFTKNYEFRSMQANFAEENDSSFLEHALFLNVGLLSIFQIVKGVFSKYFLKFSASI